MVHGLALAAVLFSAATPPPQTVATGVVFEDTNRNGVRDVGERGIAGISVSNQDEFVVTDRQGRWKLPCGEDTTFFVVKPRGWMTPVDKNQLPKFYYTHKPKGSPDLKYGGVPPTGPLPASIDFPLYRSKEPDAFKAIFFGDTQSRNLRELKYLVDDLITKMDPEGAKFGVTLGDILFDDLSIFQEHNQAIALLGIPWYNVLGNHDINFDAKTDEHSDETFERFYGPNYYSFEYGLAHFVVLDDVKWNHPSTQPDNTGRYNAELGARQMAWLKKDLERTPANRLVVLMMHIPLDELTEKKDVLELLSKRPYSLSVSAHTHYQEHRYFRDADGFTRPEPHHHVVNVTTCGGWWTGEPDAFGIPHSTMRDGAPRGYSIFTFSGNQYSIEFRAANRPRTYQMAIHAPDSVAWHEMNATDFYVNVFGGSVKSKVEFKLGDGDWMPMVQVKEKDPAYVKMVERNAKIEPPFRPLPGAIDSPHLWKATLPRSTAKGLVPIHVRTVDQFGQVYFATRGILVK